MSSAHPLPSLPTKHSAFIKYIKSHPGTSIQELVKPYNEYDSVLRRIFAQEPSNPVLADNHVNIVPLYDDNGVTDLPVRARDLSSESNEFKDKYIMPLKDEDRRPNGSPAVVPTFKEFQTNFNLFSEGSLSDLDWNNVVAAGSSVVTSVLPVPEEYRGSKRLLRQFYHQKFSPASDVDLFIYGLTDEQAIEKIKQIETKVKDALLYETTTVRTKNTITIVSQYPVRHIQIVLRIYKSIAEILTGFDVDCSCVAYDGRNVYAAPRAAASFATQTNPVDITRRSPSYENRLSKYSHRGFEIFWPQLDRSRIDPTIFERSFKRTVGLARLLILEQLPTFSDRERYLIQRRQERGRPVQNPYARNLHKLQGNIKDDWEDEVADWVNEMDVSDYHTFTTPYGEGFNARKIVRLLYSKDLLLNSEWNSKDREVNLHRHPAFVGNADDVIKDCCGHCPKPVTAEEEKVWEQESKIYISGEVSFIKDDPGRQEIGSFNPVTDTDWTEMAYVANTTRLFQAISDNDLDTVIEWLGQEGADANGRDYTGRTPLHLAAMTSTPEIVQHLVDHGAKLIWRLADGQTALHLAAARGSVEIVRILLTKSEENEQIEDEKQDKLRHKGAQDEDTKTSGDSEGVESGAENADDDHTSFATGSFVNVKKDDEVQPAVENFADEETTGEPDVYNINVLAWDNQTSPLHLAIVHGHTKVVEELVSSFGADLLLPIKLLNDWDRSPRGAILPLVLSLQLPRESAIAMVETLLRLGATPAQADLSSKTPLHYFAAAPHPELLDILEQHDEPGVKRAINSIAVGDNIHSSRAAQSALTIALHARNDINVFKLLEAGAATTIEFSDFMKPAQLKWDWMKNQSFKQNQDRYYLATTQPIISAVQTEQPSIALWLLGKGAGPNTLTPDGYIARGMESKQTYLTGESLLDVVVMKLRELREEIEKSEPPLPLYQDDQTYLGCYQVDTYQMFIAKEDLRQARERFDTSQNLYEGQKAAESRKGTAEKEYAINALIQDFQELEEELIAKGAKTFRHLYPYIDMFRQNHVQQNILQKPEPFIPKFDFEVPDLTGMKREGYVRLFEAAWSGDLGTIETLTRSLWGPENEEPPLEIALNDVKGFSPFSLAALRGHQDVAKAILQIARLQYKPQDPNGREKFSIQIGDEDSDASSADDDIRIQRDVVHDEFTINNIGEIATKVESNITPMQVLSKECQAYTLAENETVAKSMHMGRYESKCTLIEYAIWHDDIKLLTFLLDSIHDISLDDESEEDVFYSCISRNEFRLALRLGRLRCLSELIKRTGTGLPLDDFVEESGVDEAKQTSKFYQGLTIHGKKRADWAAAAQGVRPTLKRKALNPLLEAAFMGSLASVEWFLSTAPGRLYMEFTSTDKQNNLLKRLEKTKQGTEGWVINWLSLKNDLVLHGAVLSEETDESEELIRYLVKHVPNCLEVKSAEGYTPLMLAFSKHHVRFAKILINAGANQTIRDRNGNNLIHTLLCSCRGVARDKPSKIQTLLGLLDPRLIPTLLIERSSEGLGSHTPIARWMYKVNKQASPTTFAGTDYQPLDIDNETYGKVAVFELMLDFARCTGQRHLEVFDSAGNTVVHDAVKFQLPQILELILDHRPDLLERENASGCTPADLAKDAWVAECTCNPPHPLNIIQSYPKDPSGRQETILIRAPESFVKDEEEDLRSERKVIYDLCMERADKGASTKRKLVSLFEANEVAKRLAARGNQSSSSELKRDYDLAAWY